MSLGLNPHEKLELARKVEHWEYVGWMGVCHDYSGELFIRDNPAGYASPAKTFTGNLPGINLKLADLGFLSSVFGRRYVLFIHDGSGEQAD